VSLQEIDTHQNVSDLQGVIASLHQQNTSLVEEKTSLEAQVTYLKEKIEIFKLKYFGKKSEKVTRLALEQLGLLFNELEEEKAKAPSEQEELIDIPAHQRKARGKRAPLPADLPRKEVVIDLPESEKVCAEGNHPMVCIGEDVSEKLEIIPEEIYVLQTKRKKYACQICQEGVKTAALPPSILPKSNCGEGLLAYLVTAKYCDHLPLYRLEEKLGRMGVDLPRQTLARWMGEAAQQLTPILNLLQDRILESSYIQMDETRVQVLGEKRKPVLSDKFIWVRRKPGVEPLILYEYDPSRSSEVPKRLLPEYQGYLQVDGYEGYSALGSSPGVTRMGCMAHIRRKFFEVVKSKDQKANLANRFLQLIQKLYRIEQEAKGLSPEERKEKRNAQSMPLITQLEELMNESIPKVPPQSALGKALSYATHQWPFWKNYLQDGRIEIDNNGIENAIRPFALGRKNWLFSATVEGAQASCTFFSLIQTAKENGLEPYAYLKHLFEKIPIAKTIEDYEELLPLKSTPELATA